MNARLLVLLTLLPFSAQSAETCRYKGVGDQAGRLVVETQAATANGETTLSVTAQVEGRYLGVFRFQFLHQEINVWRDGELRQIGIHHRYSVNGSVKRQQWDVFNRVPEGMQAWRAQAKTLSDLQAHHPGFVRYWPPESFGQPWLAAYGSAGAKRRADLDLPARAIPPGLGTPLAMGFYWIRWSVPDGRAAPLFLPGFKEDPRLDVPISLAGTEPDGTRRIHITVRHPKLDPDRPSGGEAWVAPDRRLMRVAFEGFGRKGSMKGEARLEGCEGRPGTP